MGLDLGKLAKGLLPIISAVAPTIASLLPLPGAGLIVNGALQALGVSTEGKSTNQVLTEAQAAMNDPARLSILKEHELGMAQIEADREAKVLLDVQQAREMGSKRPGQMFVLTLIIWLAFFALTAALTYAYLANVQVNESLSIVLGSAFGVLFTAFAATVQYNFGSSLGSKTKEAALISNGRQGGTSGS